MSPFQYFLGVSTSRDFRAGVHNGMWFYKTLLLLTFCIGAFFIPDPNDLFINGNSGYFLFTRTYLVHLEEQLPKVTPKRFVTVWYWIVGKNNFLEG